MPVPVPTKLQEAFGTSAGGSYITNPIPVPSQIGITNGAASFTDGFPPLTMTELSSGGIPPFGQDMNGILYMMSGTDAFYCSGNVFPYDSTYAAAISGYKKGAVLLSADGWGFWLNKADGNVSDPEGATPVNWVPAFQHGHSIISGLTNANVALTPTQFEKTFIILEGALTGNIQIEFPDILMQWVVINNTTNAYTITAIGSVSGVLIPQTGYASATTIFNDGAGNVYANSISTAGLAPINSPHLTGIPTTPTPAVHTNTTQIASTAFVVAEIAADLATYAPLVSPAFSGLPTAPTPPTGNNSTRIATTAFVQAALTAAGQSLGPTGYQKFASGLILQWGVTGPAPSGNTPFTVTFPIPFPTACYGSQLTSSPNNGTVRVVSIAAASMSISCGQAGDVVYWLAYGS